MSDNKKGIYLAIPKIMQEVGPIGKNGVNTFDKYKFRSIDDVYNKLQPVLAKNEVFFIPDVLESHEERYESQQGKSQVRVKLKVKYKIFHSDGSLIETVVEGEGIDRSDKATNKALTAAFKYMLIQIFCIAVDGEVDGDSETLDIQAPTSKTKEIKKAKQKNNNFIFPVGPLKGKKLSEVKTPDIKKFIDVWDKAITEKGQAMPDYLPMLKQYVSEAV